MCEALNERLRPREGLIFSCLLPDPSSDLMIPGTLFWQGKAGHSLWRSVLLSSSPKDAAADVFGAISPGDAFVCP